MSPDEFALMQAIRANPADDTPRLVYADYLEERGDEASVARAEFIRVQCSGTNSERADELLGEYREQWDDKVRQTLVTQYPRIVFRRITGLEAIDVLEWSYRRGMITDLTIGVYALQRCPCLPRFIGPIEHLSIDTHDGLDELSIANLDGWAFEKLKILRYEGSDALDLSTVLKTAKCRGTVASVPIVVLDYETYHPLENAEFHANQVFQGLCNPIAISRDVAAYNTSLRVSDPLNLWAAFSPFAINYFPGFAFQILETGLTVAQRGLLPNYRLHFLVRYYQLAGLPVPAESETVPYPQLERAEQVERNSPPRRGLLTRAARWFRSNR